MSQAYWLPAHLACATCGYVMEPMGRFEGGKVIVRCSGFQCPEYGIERKYVGQLIDLQEVGAGDMDAPLEKESSELAKLALETAPDTPPSDPVPEVPAEVADAVIVP